MFILLENSVLIVLWRENIYEGVWKKFSFRVFHGWKTDFPNRKCMSAQKFRRPWREIFSRSIFSRLVTHFRKFPSSRNESGSCSEPQMEPSKTSWFSWFCAVLSKKRVSKRIRRNRWFIWNSWPIQEVLTKATHYSIKKTFCVHQQNH